MPVETNAPEMSLAATYDAGAEGDDAGPAGLNNDERGGATPINGKPSFTSERVALQLVGYHEENGVLVPEPGWGGVVGQAYTVTYAFRSSEPAQMPLDDDDSPAEGFSRFNATQIRQAELILQGWADVANITFVRVGSGESGEAAYSNEASILFGNYSSGFVGASAFAFNPGNPDVSARAGDVWINVTIGSNPNPAQGNRGAYVLAHEIGHAIGLIHPGDYNAGANQTITYAADAEYYEDSQQYTVMSYFIESNTGANYGVYYPAAPQLDDITAAQVEYGPNPSTRTGNTVYGFNSTAERPWFDATRPTPLIFAVWDAGGTDTFDFSGFAQDQLIDLRQGAFSNVGGLTGNVAVAMNAVIENAIGGSGDDRINGNGAANTLQGGAGDDVILGKAGSDWVIGGEGRNFLRGDEGDDVVTGGNDTDDAHGNMGDDTVSGGAGDDWVVGGKDNDHLYGGDGGDVVWGNLGNDTCEGGEGADQVRGGQGDDLVFGGGGGDWLSGDRGTDHLTGGAGGDIFHTFDGAGNDRVTDFNAAEGDRVYLLPGAQWGVAQVGADTVVTVAGAEGGQLTLVGVQMSTLQPGWIFT